MFKDLGKVFLDLTKRFKKQKDFTTVKIPSKVDDIQIPVIPLEKYPEITRRTKDIVIKVSEDIANQHGKSPEKVLEELDPRALLDMFPRVLEVASGEFYSLAAFILDVEEEQIKKMGLSQVIKVIKATWEHNDFAQVQQDLANFIRPLAKALFGNQNPMETGQGESSRH